MITLVKNIENIGYRELKQVIDLLTEVYNNGYPDYFEENEVEIIFNEYSGYVLLVNEVSQIAMINPTTNKLELFIEWHSGINDFYSDLVEKYKKGEYNKEQMEIIRDEILCVQIENGKV